MVFFFESFRLLALAGFFQERISETHADRAASLAGTAAFSQRATSTYFFREVKAYLSFPAIIGFYTETGWTGGSLFVYINFELTCGNAIGKLGLIGYHRAWRTEKIDLLLATCGQVGTTVSTHPYATCERFDKIGSR